MKKQFLSFALLCAATLSAHNLVNVKNVAPEVIIEMRYATPHNITGQPMRSCKSCYLCAEPANALKKAVGMLKKEGYMLKVWEAYQPLPELAATYALIPNDEVIANPDQGDAHTRGYAVDVTLVSDGMEIDMGTDYDAITVKACPDCKDLPEDVMQHRELLASVMERCGFVCDPQCWWHFDFNGWETKPNLDVPFSELE